MARKAEEGGIVAVFYDDERVIAGVARRSGWRHALTSLAR